MSKVPILARIFANHKLWVVLGTCMLMSIAIIFFWRNPKNTWLSSWPRDSNCPHSVPSPSWSGWPSLSSKNIYFVETSEQTKPTFLMTCSIESAARLHPESRIIVLINGFAEHYFTSTKYSLLRCFTNIEFKPLNMKDFFMDTPLANWYAAAQLKPGPYFLHVLSDACRLTIMWKFGGIYLDTDFIVLKSLKNLTNVLGIQSEETLNGAFLSFASGHAFIELCLQDFVANYKGEIWGYQGPHLLTRMYKKWCSIQSLQGSKGCRGVTILPQEAFYPIPWPNWRKYFAAINASEVTELFKNTYAAHVWNKLSQGTQLEITSKALLVQLYQRYCPSTYELMKTSQERPRTAPLPK